MKYKLLKHDEPIPEKTNIVLIKFEKIKEELDELKAKIKSEKILEFSDEQIKIFREKFKEVYQKYDNAKKIENNLNIEEQKNIIEKRPIDLQVIILNIDIQTLISRITNKIQREEARRIKERYRIETLTLKENILAISSLVFTAFTLIQLNFVAFQHSNSYSILDRIILFSGINIFVILGIFTIFCMIKSLIDKEENKLGNKKKSLKKTELFVIVTIILILSVIFGVSLWIKNSKEKTVEITNIEELKKDVDKFNNEIFNLNKENLELKEKIKELNFIIERDRNNLKLDFEQKNIKTKEEILNLEKEIIKLKK